MTITAFKEKFNTTDTESQHLFGDRKYIVKNIQGTSSKKTCTTNELIEPTISLYRYREINPTVTDLLSRTRLA